MNLQTAVTCLFKFADDIALVGLLLNEDFRATYFSHVSSFKLKGKRSQELPQDPTGGK